MFDAANALSVTLTGEAEFGYLYTEDSYMGASVSPIWDISLPHVVVSGEQGDLYYSFEMTEETNFWTGFGREAIVTIGRHGLGEFKFEAICEEVFDIEIHLQNCTSLTLSDVAGWEVKLLTDDIYLSDILQGVFVAGDGEIGGVSIQAAIDPYTYYYWLNSDAHFGTFGLEAETFGYIGAPFEPHRLELYSNALGPRIYIEYYGGGLGEFGAKLGAFQFAGTLSDGDAFNDLEVEWSTDLAEGLALEGQMRFGGTFQASLMTHLSF